MYRHKISVTGGKGGTGKSTVATNLAVVLSETGSLVLGDLDVEAPNDHLLLGARLEGEEPVEIMMPFIDYSKCTKCGACARACDTGAIVAPRGQPPFIFPRLCSGCRACYFVCPEKAITEGRRILGYTYETRVTLGGGFGLVTGVLREGEEHTSPVVLAARRRAERLAENLLVIDTSAGTGNNVSIAIEDSDLVIAVTEPTPLGLHDLEMILEVTSAMGLETWIVVNRAGIGDEEPVKRIVDEYGARIAARIPYSRTMVESYVSGRPIVVSKPEATEARILRRLGEEVLEVIGA